MIDYFPHCKIGPPIHTLPDWQCLGSKLIGRSKMWVSMFINYSGPPFDFRINIKAIGRINFSFQPSWLCSAGWRPDHSSMCFSSFCTPSRTHLVRCQYNHTHNRNHHHHIVIIISHFVDDDNDPTFQWERHNSVSPISCNEDLIVIYMNIVRMIMTIMITMILWFWTHEEKKQRYAHKSYFGPKPKTVRRIS